MGLAGIRTYAEPQKVLPFFPLSLAPPSLLRKKKKVTKKKKEYLPTPSLPSSLLPISKIQKLCLVLLSSSRARGVDVPNGGILRPRPA